MRLSVLDFNPTSGNGAKFAGGTDASLPAAHAALTESRSVVSKATDQAGEQGRSDQEVKDQAPATMLMRMIHAHDSCASFPGVVAAPALSSAARAAPASAYPAPARPVQCSVSSCAIYAHRSCRRQMCLDGDRFGTGDLGHLIQSGQKQRRARGAFLASTRARRAVAIRRRVAAGIPGGSRPGT
jgi:hypothetical protein